MRLLYWLVLYLVWCRVTCVWVFIRFECRKSSFRLEALESSTRLHIHFTIDQVFDGLTVIPLLQAHMPKFIWYIRMYVCRSVHYLRIRLSFVCHSLHEHSHTGKKFLLFPFLFLFYFTWTLNTFSPFIFSYHFIR